MEEGQDLVLAISYQDIGLGNKDVVRLIQGHTVQLAANRNRNHDTKQKAEGQGSGREVSPPGPVPPQAKQSAPNESHHQNDTSNPRVGRTGNMLSPVRTGGLFSYS
jgi:hypothetical protein